MFEKILREYAAPGFLIAFAPTSMVLLERCISEFDGSFLNMSQKIYNDGIFTTYFNIWKPVLIAVAFLFVFGSGLTAIMMFGKSKKRVLESLVVAGIYIGYIFTKYNDYLMPILNVKSHSTDPTAYRAIFGFSIFEIFLLKIIPGDEFYGPVTPMGNRPPYKDNGVACFIISVFSFIIFSHPASPVYLFPASIVYTNFGEIVGACNVLALTICIFLNIKGRIEPTNTDVVYRNLIFSYYWGIELHPNILTISVKQFTNCRFGMMGWAIIIISFAAGQYEKFGHVTDAMIVSVCLQVIYIFKFFWWEAGYFATMDMTTDRAGFYICWGCITWLTTLYTSASYYIALHSGSMGPIATLIVSVFGLSNIWFNYAADLQRKVVRDTNGDCKVWGEKPKLIRAKYTAGDGSEHSNLLLASGYWAISRHSHYLFEILAAFSWCVPSCLITGVHFSLIPLSYVIFLTILLFDRSVRDDKRCSAKYGKFWDQYRTLVPYKIIPGIF